MSARGFHKRLTTPSHRNHAPIGMMQPPPKEDKMADPLSYLINLPDDGRPHDVHIPETWYPGVQEHWDQSTSSRIFDAIMGVKAVVIHATAGSSSAGAMSVMKGHKASWHWLVPDENEDEHGKLVWACAPEARAAWHVRNTASAASVNGGANRVNHWSVGIEIVNRQPNSPGSDPFSEWQVEVTAQIVRYCWAKYPNLKQVVSHAILDPERRTDPGEQFPWSRFEQLVLSGPSGGNFEELVANAKPLSALAESKDVELCCMGPSK